MRWYNCDKTHTRHFKVQQFTLSPAPPQYSEYISVTFAGYLSMQLEVMCDLLRLRVARPHFISAATNVSQVFLGGYFQWCAAECSVLPFGESTITDLCEVFACPVVEGFQTLRFDIETPFTTYFPVRHTWQHA
jgi:hypothetical protein